MLCLANSAHTVVKVCLPVDDRIMPIVIERKASCKENLIEFLSDGEGCMNPTAVILDKVNKNKSSRYLANEVLSLRNRIINNKNQGSLIGNNEVIPTEESKEFKAKKFVQEEEERSYRG